jgi:hypothetical protein
VGGQINYDDTLEVSRLERSATTRLGSPYHLQTAVVTRTGRFYPCLKVLGDFMESVPFGRMTLQPRLSSTVMCLAEPGVECVAYTSDGGRIVMDLTATGGSFVAEWLNPRTGESSKPHKIQGDSKPVLAALDENDWVLNVKRGE